MRDFWRASFVCLLIALAVSVVIACSHRYSLVVVNNDPMLFRIDHWTGRIARVLPDVDAQGNPVGVEIYDHVRFPLPPAATAPKDFARADLREVYLVRLRIDGDTCFLTLYNGTAIDFSELTFRVRTARKEMEEVRLYRTQVDLQPFAVTDVPVTIITDDVPPKEVAIVSAKGIRQ
ncbi:MAG TPA: hypothetical protein VF173_27575 [Thermoanaerobaculia bacterium]|nr:hypothetical protein [Thermoanaerobaculia bacterium]